MSLNFFEILFQNGWKELDSMTYVKGKWQIAFDTSSWMELKLENFGSLFGLPLEYEGKAAEWQIRIIEQFFIMEEQRLLFSEALRGINSVSASLEESKQIAKEALAKCSHHWSGSYNSTIVCQLCHQVKLPEK